MKVELIYDEGCPNWRTVADELAELLGEVDFTLELRESSTLDPSLVPSYRGSPTVLIDGRDPFAGADVPVRAACRVYPTPQGLSGAPTLDQLRAAVHEARRPRER